MKKLPKCISSFRDTACRFALSAGSRITLRLSAGLVTVTSNAANYSRGCAVGEHITWEVIQNYGSRSHDRFGTDSEPPGHGRSNLYGSCPLQYDPPAQMDASTNPNSIFNYAFMFHAGAGGQDHIFTESAARINDCSRHGDCACPNRHPGGHHSMRMDGGGQLKSFGPG